MENLIKQLKEIRIVNMHVYNTTGDIAAKQAAVKNNVRIDKIIDMIKKSERVSFKDMPLVFEEAWCFIEKQVSAGSDDQLLADWNFSIIGNLLSEKFPVDDEGDLVAREYPDMKCLDSRYRMSFYRPTIRNSYNRRFYPNNPLAV